MTTTEPERDSLADLAAYWRLPVLGVGEEAVPLGHVRCGCCKHVVPTDKARPAGRGKVPALWCIPCIKLRDRTWREADRDYRLRKMLRKDLASDDPSKVRLSDLMRDV